MDFRMLRALTGAVRLIVTVCYDKVTNRGPEAGRGRAGAGGGGVLSHFARDKRGEPFTAETVSSKVIVSKMVVKELKSTETPGEKGITDQDPESDWIISTHGYTKTFKVTQEAMARAVLESYSFSDHRLQFALIDLSGDFNPGAVVNFDLGTGLDFADLSYVFDSNPSSILDFDTGLVLSFGPSLVFIDGLNFLNEKEIEICLQPRWLVYYYRIAYAQFSVTYGGALEGITIDAPGARARAASAAQSEKQPVFKGLVGILVP
ncbi:hypothetical protein EVAR_47012_1 [Eumeta japonica]|uniref:Uncharacterized protein n=1 Tax=Eumeta variegata TaxID=151549 RepID=A0A4C1XK42_EUMVA|nr:hypothetical protein EVAR_47012_1 [Eumeta japonica]